MATLPAAAAGDAAFRVFCTPALSDKRGENYAALAERARFHLRSAKRVMFKTPVGQVQGYVLNPPSAVRGTVLVIHARLTQLTSCIAQRAIGSKGDPARVRRPLRRATSP